MRADKTSAMIRVWILIKNKTNNQQGWPWCFQSRAVRNPTWAYGRV